jgi:hypothetical protein
VTPQLPDRTVWLSGTILTLLNKLVFPIVWLVFVGGTPVFVYLRTGHLGIAKGFEFIVAFALIASVLLAWLTVHIQGVGYANGELVVANYWREARIPFKQVVEVALPWWGRRQLVRIRFRSPTPFGETVYYIPKWAPVRALFGSPAEELRQAISSGDAAPLDS